MKERRCEQQNKKFSLAMLYAKEGMPADLVKAHNALDKAVDAAYGYKGKKTMPPALLSFLNGIKN